MASVKKYTVTPLTFDQKLADVFSVFTDHL